MERKSGDEGRQNAEECGNREGKNGRRFDTAKNSLHSLEKVGKVLVGDGGDCSNTTQPVGQLEMSGDGLNYSGGVRKGVHEAAITGHQHGDNLDGKERKAKPPWRDRS